jgi:hypothetical protein
MAHAPFIRISSLCALVFAVMTLHAQTADRPAHKLDWALKVQAYSPLSWLAEPLNGKRDFPFTPRFWTGEVELGFSERSSVQLSVGVRHVDQPLSQVNPNPSFFEQEISYKATASFRNYLKYKHKGAVVGPYLAPSLGFLHAKGAYKTGAIEFQNEFTTIYFSTAVALGWQFCFKKHVLLDLGAGPEIAYQNTHVKYELSPLFRRVTPLEYLAIPIWRNQMNRRAGIGITGKAIIGIGWKF